MKYVIAGALALLCAGCPCGTGYPGFESDFENCGEQRACGWAVQGDGDVALVPTIHPGEHGIELSGQVSISVPTSVTGGDYYNDGQWLEYVTNCDGAAELEVVPSPQGGWELALTLPPGHTNSSSTDYTIRHLSFPPISRDEYQTYTISGVTLKNLSGRCVIDRVRIMTPSECP